MKKFLSVLVVALVALVACDKEPSAENYSVTFAEISCSAESSSATITTKRPTVMLNGTAVDVEESAIALIFRKADDEQVVSEFTSDGDNITFALLDLEAETHYAVKLQYDGGSRGIFLSDEVEFTTTEAEVPVPDTKFEILSSATIEIGAEGGEVIVEYLLENPKEGVELEVSATAEWIAKSTAEGSENRLSFVVQANTAEEVRSAAIRLKYDSIEHEVTVNQAAAEPEPEPTATELPYLSGIYFGNQYGATEADYNYSVVLATIENCVDIISGEQYVYPNNTYLYLDLYADSPSANYNVEFTIPEGEYHLDLECSSTAGTLGGEYTMLYIADEAEGVEIHFVDGVVKVSAEGIEARFTDEAGNSYEYTCPTATVDNSKNFVGAGMHGEFSTLEGDLAIPFDDGALYAEGYGDYYVVGKDLWTLYVDDYATGHGFVFEVLTPLSDELPTGEFTISSDLNLERMALPGYVDGYGDSMWSWYYYYDESGEIAGQAPIVEGSFTIVDNGDDTFTASFDLVDDCGNSITGECVAYFEYYDFDTMSTRATITPRTAKPARK